MQISNKLLARTHAFRFFNIVVASLAFSLVVVASLAGFIFALKISFGDSHFPSNEETVLITEFNVLS